MGNHVGTWLGCCRGFILAECIRHPSRCIDPQAVAIGLEEPKHLSVYYSWH